MGLLSPHAQYSCGPVAAVCDRSHRTVHVSTLSGPQCSHSGPGRQTSWSCAARFDGDMSLSESRCASTSSPALAEPDRPGFSLAASSSSSLNAPIAPSLICKQWQMCTPARVVCNSKGVRTRVCARVLSCVCARTCSRVCARARVCARVCACCACVPLCLRAERARREYRAVPGVRAGGVHVRARPLEYSG